MNQDVRNVVFHRSLLIERNVTISLAAILGISKDSSKTMSNKSSALSFKTKIDLLTDIQALPREDAKKFEYFMQIRNQFMHNYESDTFTNCLKYIEGLDNKLLKLYPPSIDETDRETHLRDAYDKLFFDLLKSLEKLLEVISGKSYQDGLLKGKLEGYEIVVESLREVLSEIDNGDDILDRVYTLAKQKNEQHK